MGYNMTMIYFIMSTNGILDFDTVIARPTHIDIVELSNSATKDPTQNTSTHIHVCTQDTAIEVRLRSPTHRSIPSTMEASSTRLILPTPRLEKPSKPS